MAMSTGASFPEAAAELHDLADIFGIEDTAMDLEARARASRNMFVRTHTDLARWTEGEGGQVLTASQALDAFGWPVLRKLTDRVAVPIIRRGCQIGGVIRDRRVATNLTKPQLARASGLTISDIEAVEAGRGSMPMSTLTKLAQALALDVFRIGFVENGGGDLSLGVRLRELQNNRSALSPTLVLGLLEAAWVIAEQSKLEMRLDRSRGRSIVQLGFRPRAIRNDAWPTVWQQGADLAAETRRLLGYEPAVPITRLLSEVEDRLAIPVVPVGLASTFAGATIENDQTRGIAINVNGINSNVWTRRMTVAHELGHLLWDPSADLKHLRVNLYTDLEKDARSLTDQAEMRVNAFAAEFLAPKAVVVQLYYQYGANRSAVSRIAEEYGISVKALSWQLHNGSDGKIQQSRVSALPGTRPSERWQADENRRSDFFVFNRTPISRTGRFVQICLRALDANLLSLETLADHLHVAPQTLAGRLNDLRSLVQGSEA